ncbi:hypothetical protein [Patulibacter sp. SYSU D01012]|uniref:hypothetical protein n=1 Tax=Patulibacter sp. SYSU D01012 TaxID=2817381 RepID=UPI001B30ABE2|nr:hypothetical protein [Patulibacter sp. SYSU D01012]
MSTDLQPVIPATDVAAIRGLTKAIRAATQADGSEALARLCNHLLRPMLTYMGEATGRVPSPDGPAPDNVLAPAQAVVIDAAARAGMTGPAGIDDAAYEAANSTYGALRTLEQHIGFRDATDPELQNAIDAMSWRLRDAISLLRTGRR